MRYDPYMNERSDYHRQVDRRSGYYSHRQDHDVITFLFLAVFGSFHSQDIFQKSLIFSPTILFFVQVYR